MIDVAIIPREKFSRVGDCLSSLLPLREQLSEVFLFDVGYPQPLLERHRSVIDLLRIEVLRYPEFRLANACLNDLAAHGSEPWFLLLENDCAISPSDLQAAIQRAEKDGFAVVQPRILEADGSVHYDPPLSFIERTDVGIVHRVVRNPRPGFPPVPSIRRTFHVEKHALLIRRNVLETLGDFEDFLVTRSHWDLSFRLHEQGHAVIADPSIEVRFLGGKLSQDDLPYFKWRWDREKAIRSNEYIRTKWKVLNYHSSVEWLDEMLASAQLDVEQLG
jgi:GT2 family glycosyltransferase